MPPCHSVRFRCHICCCDAEDEFHMYNSSVRSTLCSSIRSGHSAQLSHRHNVQHCAAARGKPVIRQDLAPPNGVRTVVPCLHITFTRIYMT